MKRTALLFLILFLVACGGGEPEVVVVTATTEPATPEPTAVPTIEPSATPPPSPEPTATATATATPTPLPDVRTLDFSAGFLEASDIPSRLRVGDLREDYTILYDLLDSLTDSTDPSRIISHQFFHKTSTTDEDQEGAIVVFLYDNNGDAAAAFAFLTRALFVNNSNHNAIPIPDIGQQSQAGNEVIWNRLVVQECRALIFVMMDGILDDEADMIEVAQAATDYMSQVVCW